MSDSSAPNDLLRLEGLGGLFNGEVFVLKPGESGTFGATSLATFPVTLCRNYRRLEGDPSREELLARLAPEHVRLIYLGDGRLIVENLAGGEVHVGWGRIEDRTEVDLTEGRVEIVFGYGERVVAGTPDSPAEYQEFAPPPSEGAEVEGVFMALLSPDGAGAGILETAAERLREKEQPDEYELLPEPEDEPPADPAHETGPIPPVSAPEPPPARKRGRRGRRRPGPGLFFSVLIHLVAILGLFAWVRKAKELPAAPPIVVVEMGPGHTAAKTPAPPPRVKPREVADTTVDAPSPVVRESEASRSADPGGPGETDAGGGAGAAGLIGTGPGGPGAGLTGTGPAFASGVAGGGGTAPKTFDVRLALDWLARHQLPDGSWSAVRSLAACRDCTGPGRREYPVAMTGLALAAFVGAGQTHRAGDDRETVSDGLRWLLGRQGDRGSFHGSGATEEDRPVYGDAMATLALAELYRESGSPLLKRPLVRGVRFLVSAQRPYAGWRYLPGSRETDTSVTGWASIALTAADRTGIEVNPASRFGVLTWLEDMTDPASFRVGYRERGRGSPGMTATALALRLHAGETLRDDAVRHGREFLRENPPVWPDDPAEVPPGNPPDLLYWYFGAIAASNLGGDDCRAWAREVLDVLGPRQARSGESKGSFPPPGRWSRIGGRVFTTALAAMLLEVVRDYPTAFK